MRKFTFAIGMNSGLQMTMHYVSLGKSHIREQAEKLNSIHRLPSSAPGISSRTLAQHG
jgi:hypothetical protein